MRVQAATADDGFLHPAITQAVKDGWDQTVLGASVLGAISGGDPWWVEKDDGGVVQTIVWRGFIRRGSAWVEIAARAKRHESRVRFCYWPGYGDVEGNRSSLLPRVQGIKVEPHGIVLDDGQGGPALHGQPLTLQAIDYDFDGQVLYHATELDPFGPSDYAPMNPNRTGIWAHAGMTLPVAEMDERDVYPIARYAGMFRKTDGSYFTEEDAPDTGGSSHFNEHARDTGPIRYTDPNSPWRDKPAGGARNPDGQHFTITDALCQWFLHTRDPGAALAIIGWAHMFRRQFPGRPEGTTNHKPGAGRERGRVIRAGVWLYRALMWMGDAEKALAEKVAIRVAERVQNQLDDFQTQVAKGESPWPGFGAVHGDYAPHELGVWYTGLLAVRQVLDAGGFEWSEVRALMRAISARVFADVRQWPNYGGARGWAPPYWVVPADPTIHREERHSGAPSSMFFLCYRAAIDHEPQNEAERQKHEALLAYGEGLEERWKR